MKLIICKDQESNILVKVKIERETIEFNYPVFIEKLFDGDKLEETQYSKEITEEEKEKMNAMIEEIVKLVKKKKKV